MTVAIHPPQPASLAESLLARWRRIPVSVAVDLALDRQIDPASDAVLSATADTEPTQRDCHIQAIASKGRMAWQRDSGYNERARVEGQFARWKQVIGDGLRFHSDQARATEVAIRPRSSTECSTLDARTPSALHDQQWGMGVPFSSSSSVQHAASRSKS